MTMKMRKLLSSAAIAFTMVMTSGCEKYTDIVPKGQNLLDRAGDLDLLLNVNYVTNSFTATRQALLDNDMYLVAANVPNTISSGVLTMNKVLLTYDESADRASLALTDASYEGLYRIISTVCNIVLENADKATGDPTLLKQLKAEAYIIRAYLHYWLVNLYAKAYDPATAATDGGVPYVKTLAIAEVNKKNTVKEVYDNLLSDIDAAIASGALPDKPKNNMRVGVGFAYAVKAKVLLSMRDYANALVAVNESLKYNSQLEDHRQLLATPKEARVLIRNGLRSPDNVFYAVASNIDPTLFSPSYEILRDWYEPGNIIKDSTNTYNYQLGMLYVGLPDIPAWLAPTYESNGAGITTSDLVLMKAECLIRTNKVNEGVEEINKIRIRRVAPYTALTASTEAAAMAILQKTSRIEFLYTMKNFINIKRWNKEGTYPITIERTINGTKYVLQPNSPLWIFPFPQSATQFNETLTQNY
jgi:starch-binding outer membrane protein, SusD/RagB family